MTAFKIRPYKPEDARAALEVHYKSVHWFGEDFYPQDILREWSPIVDNVRIKSFSESNRGGWLIVAEMCGEVVGFGALGRENTLRACYVHPHYGGEGIGKSLVSTLEEEAKARGWSHLYLDASLNAERFYQNCGFKKISDGVHSLRGGLEMACVKMRKNLSS